MAWKRWEDWSNLVLGAYLLFVPSMFGLSGTASMMTVLAGIAIGIVALWALAAPKSQGAEWTNVTLGALYFLAPWLFRVFGDHRRGLERVDRRAPGSRPGGNRVIEVEARGQSGLKAGRSR
jgi:membrane protein implicated in regulation of membrane protease activity